MSPVSRLARLLLILHGVVNFALGVYSFIKPEEVAAITGMEASDEALQTIGSLYPFFSTLPHDHIPELFLNISLVHDISC